MRLERLVVTTIYWTTTQKNFYYSDTTQKVFYYWPTTNANLITSLPHRYPPQIWSYSQVFTDLPPTYSLQKLWLFLRTRLALDRVPITATVALDAPIFLVFWLSLVPFLSTSPPPSPSPTTCILLGIVDNSMSLSLSPVPVLVLVLVLLSVTMPLPVPRPLRTMCHDQDRAEIMPMH